MLSRVADSIYWMSRYVERAENVARFLDVNENLTLGEGVDLDEQWAPLVYTTGDQERFAELYGEYRRDAVLRFLAFDPRNPNSILSCVAAARENARSVRESITGAMWEQVNKFHLMVKSAVQNPRFLAEPNQFCDMVKHASHSLVGTTDATMSHNDGWHFSRIARLLERADKTSRILDVQYYHLLPDVADVGIDARRRPLERPAAVGQRPDDVPAGPRPDHPRTGGRFLAAGPEFPAVDAVLPDAGTGILERNHRKSPRNLQLHEREARRAITLRDGLHGRGGRGSAGYARIHRSVPDPPERNRRRPPQGFFHARHGRR